MSLSEKYVIGFFVETTFHYYVYESIINELLELGLSCHIVINDNFKKDKETIIMYQDLKDYLEKLERTDIEVYTVSAIRENQYIYDCMVSPYYSPWLKGISKKHVRALYGMLAKGYWNYAWWNVFYDKILCYSHYDYARLNIYNNCSIVGNPKFDNWFKRKIPNISEVKENLTLEKEKKNILYAPTYGHLSSIDKWIKEINGLQNDYNVIIKLHHGTAFRDSETYRREYINQNFINISVEPNDLLALFEISDFVITDNSGMIFESMLVEKDVLLLNCDNQQQVKENNDEFILRSTIKNINKDQNIYSILKDKELFEKQKINVKKAINNVYTLKDGNSGKRASVEILNLLSDDKEYENEFLISLRLQIFGA
ncbi:CDP-glycerol glycerophosphotransferase family protein [Peribacillus sp. FSL H8-0477]|uniref:CDP-glycerol glycerophosphotransferase family protein n=1 Tax=Peribacillus sp. FSL H8-0477 TaxID=2921388 RepID=UPI0030F82F33